jgi:hypothetical protein
MRLLPFDNAGAREGAAGALYIAAIAAKIRE